MARMAKSRIWMVAPEAYQNGPETPYCHATLEDWRRVAAQVHWETMTAAVRPVVAHQARQLVQAWGGGVP